MGRHKRSKKTNKNVQSNSAVIGIFDFFDAAINALTSIFNSEDAGKRKKYYRVYKHN
jgi:hypothetical protein